MASNCNKYLEPTGVVLGKSTRVLGKVTLTTDGTYDSTKEYDRISLVYDPNTYISYISKQHVPAGTALSNTEYWQPLNSAILGPGQSLSGILNMLNSLDLPSVSGFLHYNEDNNSLEWVDVEQLIEIINNSGLELPLNEPLKSINSLNTSATQAGQMLIYNGTQWKLDKVANIPQALGEPLKSIATLGTPSGTNKVIMYKNGSWSYQDASSINLGNLLTHINTKNAPVPTTSGYLYYNGSAYSWMPGTGGGPTNLNELLSKLNTTSMPPASQQRYLYWNGLSFGWNVGTGATDWANIVNKPTTLSGYGITANDTLLSNLSGRINSLENKVPVALQEPILSINNINSNPLTVGSILVYRENGWQFEAKPSGGSGTGNYDDTWIYTWKNTLENTTIPGLRSTLTSVQNELNNKLSATENEVKGWINDALTTYKWWEDNTIVDQIFHQSGWSDELEAYLQQVGVLDSNGNLNYSSITQRIDQIEAQVALLQPGDDGDFEALQAQLNEYIADVNGVKTAITTLGTKYALLDENQEIIRWLASGFTSQTSQYGSLADMFAATNNAIADVNTRVDTTQTELGQEITARSTLSTQVNGIANMTGTSTIVSSVTAVDGKIQNAKNEIISGLGGNLASVITQATLDGAMASLISNNGQATSAISTLVSGDSSIIALVADQVIASGDLVARALVTQNNGYGWVEIRDGLFKAFNGVTSNCQVEFGKDSNDQLILKYYDKNGNLIWELCPDGLVFRTFNQSESFEADNSFVIPRHWDNNQWIYSFDSYSEDDAVNQITNYAISDDGTNDSFIKYLVGLYRSNPATWRANLYGTAYRYRAQVASGVYNAGNYSKNATSAEYYNGRFMRYEPSAFTAAGSTLKLTTESSMGANFLAINYFEIWDEAYSTPTAKTGGGYESIPPLYNAQQGNVDFTVASEDTNAAYNDPIVYFNITAYRDGVVYERGNYYFNLNADIMNA